MTDTSKGNVLKGKELITIGIFSAIYFVINFIFMLASGLHPLIWVLMPGFIALFAGIPFLMMCAKVQKTGAVILMGLITGLIYFVTGQFTVIILITFLIGCVMGEICRLIGRYKSFAGNMMAYVFFSLGMTGSPLPVWLMREEFLEQISGQGMPQAYVSTLESLTSDSMLIVMFGAPIVGGVLGALIAKGMFKKHFEKAGMV